MNETKKCCGSHPAVTPTRVVFRLYCRTCERSVSRISYDAARKAWNESVASDRKALVER